MGGYEPAEQIRVLDNMTYFSSPSPTIRQGGVQPPTVIGASVTGPKTGPGFDVFVVTKRTS